MNNATLNPFTVVIHDMDDDDTNIFPVDAESAIDAASLVSDYLIDKYGMTDEEFWVVAVFEGHLKDVGPKEAGWHIVNDERRGNIYTRDDGKMLYTRP